MFRRMRVCSNILSLLRSIPTFPRAIFYNNNPEAGKTKGSSHKPCTDRKSLSSVVVPKSIEVGGSTSGASETLSFPLDGWSTKASLLPVVSAATPLNHLMRTGKSVFGDECTIVQKPLRRGTEFFFCG